MPCDCGLLCLFTERRRHIEVLWRRRLLVTDDERKAKRRFLNLMRGFDTEDLDVLRKAIESGGINIKQCAPGPPMDLIEEREESSSSSGEEMEQEPEMMPGCSTTIVSTRPRHSIKQMERDRILFQRQRFPTVASIQHQPASATSTAAFPALGSASGSARHQQYQRRYSTHREQLQQQQLLRNSCSSRRDSKFSGTTTRRFATIYNNGTATEEQSIVANAGAGGGGATFVSGSARTAVAASAIEDGAATELGLVVVVDNDGTGDDDDDNYSGGAATANDNRRRHRRQRLLMGRHRCQQSFGGDAAASSSVGATTAVASPTTRSRAQQQQQQQQLLGAETMAAAVATANPDAGLIPQIDKPMSMPYLCCKMWRWKDLQVDAALHRLDPLPWCRFGRVTINNATVSCCNPYHYGLWIKPETASASSDEQSIASGVLANGGQRQQQQCDAGSSPLTSPIAGLGGDTTIGHVRTAFQHSLQAARATGYGGGTDEMTPPALPPPAPPTAATFVGNSSEWHHQTGNHMAAVSGTNRRVSHSVHCQAMSWGRMVRWQRNERVGDVVTLLGQFAVVGRLAGTVFDGQDVRTAWDVENAVSFALLRQASDEVSETLDEIWLYNSSDQPLFMCISRNVARASAPSSDSALVPNIRRLSPGYCVRVHRICTAALHGASSGVVDNSSPLPLSASASPLHRHHHHHHHAAAAAAPSSVIAADQFMPTPMMTLTQQQPATTTTALSLLTISVGVGWGANYECRCVTDLPCRYEVIFTC